MSIAERDPQNDQDAVEINRLLETSARILNRRDWEWAEIY